MGGCTGGRVLRLAIWFTGGPQQCTAPVPRHRHQAEAIKLAAGASSPQARAAPSLYHAGSEEPRRPATGAGGEGGSAGGLCKAGAGSTAATKVRRTHTRRWRTETSCDQETKSRQHQSFSRRERADLAVGPHRAEPELACRRDRAEAGAPCRTGPVTVSAGPLKGTLPLTSEDSGSLVGGTVGTSAEEKRLSDNVPACLPLTLPGGTRHLKPQLVPHLQRERGGLTGTRFTEPGPLLQTPRV